MSEQKINFPTPEKLALHRLTPEERFNKEEAGEPVVEEKYARLEGLQTQIKDLLRGPLPKVIDASTETAIHTWYESLQAKANELHELYSMHRTFARALNYMKQYPPVSEAMLTNYQKLAEQINMIMAMLQGMGLLKDSQLPPETSEFIPESAAKLNSFITTAEGRSRLQHLLENEFVKFNRVRKSEKPSLSAEQLATYEQHLVPYLQTMLAEIVNIYGPRKSR